MKSPNTIMQSSPLTGEISSVFIPVKVVFVWSDKIIDEVDEDNNPTSYKEGYLMKVVNNQEFVYDGESRIIEAYGFFEEE